TYFWNVEGNGNFSAASSWDAGSPSGAGNVAVLGGFITAPHTVTVDSPNTVGTLTFDSLNGYTVAGNSTLTLDGGGASANVNVYKGSHAISAPMALNSGTNISVDPAGGLTIIGALSGNGAITKVGGGTLTISGGNSYTGATTVSTGKLV